MSKKIRVMTVIGFVVSALLIGLTVQRIDFGTLADTLQGLSFGWLAVAVAVNIVVMVVKGYRWREAIVVDTPIRFSQTFNVLMVGSMLSNILPLKAGEVLRAILLGRQLHRSSANLLSSVGVDRIMDNMGFFAMVALAPLWFELPAGFLPVAAGLLLLLLGVFIGLFILSRWKWERTRIPAKGFRHYLHQLSFGLGALSRPRRLAALAICSFVSWMLQVGVILGLQQAFHMVLPSWAPMFILLVVNLAIALPSTPGHFGTFEYAIIFALVAQFHLPKETALGFALVYHLIQWIPITLWGWILLGRMGLRVKDLPTNGG